MALTPHHSHPSCDRLSSVIFALSTGVGLFGIVTPAQARPLQSLTVAQNQANQTLNLIYVSPNTGNDSDEGTEQSPLRTITQALRAAKPNTAIILAPGTYSAQTGEQFPLSLRSGVTLQGNPNTKGQRILILGGGWFISPTFARQSITMLGANGARVSGVTITNPSDRGYGLWIESSSMSVTNNTFTGSTHDGISIVGNSSPVIQDNLFTQNGANGITVYGTSRPEIRNNEFQNTGFGINIAEDAAPFISGNRITFNKDGIVIQANAHPILRDNSIERNQRDGVVAIAQASPDLGSSQEPGRNLIQNNGRYDLHNGTKGQRIQAHGNQLAKLEGAVEISGTYTGTSPIATRLLANRADQDQQNSDPSAISPVNTTAALPIFLPNAPGVRPQSQSQSQPQILATTQQPEIAPAANTETAIPISVLRPQTQLSAPSLAPDSGNQIPISASQPPRQPSSILARLTTKTPRSNPTSSGAIPIPVPPPESNRPATLLPPSNPLSDLSSSGTLPVPRMNIPISGEGYVPTELGASIGGGSSPVVLGLQYRVVIEGNSYNLYQRVQAIVPEAFWTEVGGKQVIQVGAFRDRAEAEDLIWRLSQRGIATQLRPFN
ncbi:MAG: DUF1565 domain-containing protein [Oscillatoriales cyanobacterium RM2_1_1]|nr:DUF1565 domain-containing protein [Oscillatoriales cyanobacterium SM2_3_0]NJO47299.1 DUF1565 domain-containing protein [Oscillatoriales cyanobacterium RM2_1_1]